LTPATDANIQGNLRYSNRTGSYLTGYPWTRYDSLQSTVAFIRITHRMPETKPVALLDLGRQSM
jgi:hypothetical protein